MAQTDSRAGFRLPWSSERPTTESSDVQVESDGQDSSGWANTLATPETTDTSPAADPTVTAEGDTVNDIQTALAGPATAVEPARPAPRKPSKFLADLSKAMQAAAEEARNGSLSQFQADAKNHVEKIHERSATEAAALRRAADDDVAAVREWSKAEIARIREETESRITSRKGRLESEIEGHAAQIEREIERVHGRVSAFEHEMAEFFERLLAEDDPGRIATMAERLPEPPMFDEIVGDSTALYGGSPVADVSYSAVETEPEAVASDEAPVDGATPVLETLDYVEADAEPVESGGGRAEQDGGGAAPIAGGREAAGAGDQAPPPTAPSSTSTFRPTSRSTARPRSRRSRQPPRPPRAPRSQPMPPSVPRLSPTSRSSSSAPTTKKLAPAARTSTPPRPRLRLQPTQPATRTTSRSSATRPSRHALPTSCRAAARMAPPRPRRRRSW